MIEGMPRRKSRTPTTRMADSSDARTLVTGLEKLDFHHPYTPYDVQEQFMKTVYDVLQKGDGQVGILESPTGTVSDKAPPLANPISKSIIWLSRNLKNPGKYLQEFYFILLC